MKPHSLRSMLRAIRITQRQVDLWSLCFMIVICSILFLTLLFFNKTYDQIQTIASGITVAILLVSLLLYRRGFHNPARFFTIILLCSLVVTATTEPFVTQTISIVVYMVPVLGMLLLGRIGFFTAILIIYIGMLYRSNFQGAHADSAAIILTLMYAGFITIMSFRFDTEKAYVEEEEAKLRASIASFPRGYILTDLKGNILLSNKLIETIFNLVRRPRSLDDIQKQLGEIFNLTSLHTKMLEDRKAVIVDEVSYSGKFLRILLSPIYIADDQIIGGVILVEDLTEERVMQRSKDEFFSIASHELRTPLTAIRGNASMIKDYYAEMLKDPDLKLMLSDIHDSSVRLITIVNDFLDMSRLEQQDMTFNKVKTNLGDIIESSVNEVKSLAEEKKIPINIEAPEDKSLLQVNTDIDRVKQILINLLGNSIRFTEKGGITIRVKNEDKFLKTSVEDTGSGIPLKNQNLLFRKFQQASDNILTRDTTRSTGLGLYISKLIVENLGGKIYLEKSEEGKGSIFTFTLPIN